MDAGRVKELLLKHRPHSMELLRDHFEQEKITWEMDFFEEVIVSEIHMMVSKSQISREEWSDIRNFVDQNCRYEDLKVIFKDIVQF